MEHPIEAAFRSRYQGYLKLALKYLHSQEDAEEAVQQGFLRAWEHRDQLRGEACSAWIWSIVANECRDRLRRRNRECHSLHDPLDRANEPAVHSRVLERLQEEQKRRLISRALPGLKPVLRECIGDILAGQAAMDFRHGTMKSRKHRAIAQLRKTLRLS